MSNEEETEETQNLENEKALAETKKAVVELQKATAEAQKATAEAQKATVEALIPATKLEPLGGKTEADEKFGYIAELVAYQSLKESAQEIGKEINSKLDPNQNHKVLIVHSLDFATEVLSLLHLESIFKYYEESIGTQLKANDDLIAAALAKKRRKIAPPVLTAVTGVVGVAANVLGYFKTDYKITGQDFDLQDHAILANVVKSITSVPVHIFKFNLIESSEIFTKFSQLLKKVHKLQTTIAQLKSIITNKRIPAQVKKGDKHDEVNSSILASETLVTAFSSFVESITKTPEDKTPPLLLQAILIEQIRKNEFTHLLNLKILSAGGEAITTQQRIWKSGKTIFIGGSAISYILAQKDGTCIIANTHHGLAHLNYDLGKAEHSLKVQNLGTLDNPNARALSIN